MANRKLQISQLLITIHIDGLPSQLERKISTTKDFFDMADVAKMRVSHKERNQWSCDGYRCIHYALVSEAFLRQVNSQLIC
jgi:hypothetical protein